MEIEVDAEADKLLKTYTTVRQLAG